jgi:hypothetical protein
MAKASFSVKHRISAWIIGCCARKPTVTEENDQEIPAAKLDESSYDNIISHIGKDLLPVP